MAGPAGARPRVAHPTPPSQRPGLSAVPLPPPARSGVRRGPPGTWLGAPSDFDCLPRQGWSRTFGARPPLFSPSPPSFSGSGGEVGATRRCWEKVSFCLLLWPRHFCPQAQCRGVACGCPPRARRRFNSPRDRALKRWAAPSARRGPDPPGATSAGRRPSTQTCRLVPRCRCGSGPVASRPAVRTCQGRARGPSVFGEARLPRGASPEAPARVGTYLGPRAAGGPPRGRGAAAETSSRASVAGGRGVPDGSRPPPGPYAAPPCRRNGQPIRRPRRRLPKDQLYRRPLLLRKVPTAAAAARTTMKTAGGGGGGPAGSAPRGRGAAAERRRCRSVCVR